LPPPSSFDAVVVRHEASIYAVVVTLVAVPVLSSFYSSLLRLSDIKSCLLATSLVSSLLSSLCRRLCTCLFSPLFNRGRMAEEAERRTAEQRIAGSNHRWGRHFFPLQNAP
jgi:hypothetical protein